MDGRLIAYGCSNTYGEGLKDCWPIDEQGNQNPSKFAWPALLAEQLGRECLNLAVPGTSNKFICNKILNTEFQENDIVVIMYTYFSRTCFFQDDGTIKRLMVRDLDRKDLDKAEKKYVKEYYSRFYTNIDSDIDNFMRINLVKHYLDSKKIKSYNYIWAINERVSNKHLGTTSYNMQHIPDWNAVNLIKIKQPTTDLAIDKRHPGHNSHRNIAKVMFKMITEENEICQQVEVYTNTNENP